MQGRTETILRHLANCPNVDQSVRTMAAEEKVGHGLIRSPPKRRQNRAPLSAPHLQVPQPSAYQYSALALPSTASGSSQIMTPATFSSGILFSNSIPPSLTLSPHPSPYYSNTPSPLNTTFNFREPTHILSPLESPNISDNSIVLPPAKRQRVSSSRSYHITTSPVQEWTSANQARFDTMVARITASCGFPFVWVENPEWLRFIQEFIPNAVCPSRWILTNRLIPSEVESYRAAAKLGCQGLYSTLQYDGWTAINNHHFLAFRMTLSDRTVSCFFLEQYYRRNSQLFLDPNGLCHRYIRRTQNCTTVSRKDSESQGDRRKGLGCGGCRCYWGRIGRIFASKERSCDRFAPTPCP